MTMLSDETIAEAGLTDWRKLGQGLHARFLLDDFGSGAAFLTEVAVAGERLGHQPRVRMGRAHVDLELVSEDAVFRGSDGVEHVVQWTTAQDVELARVVSAVAADRGLRADPASVGTVELALDTPDPARVAPVWAALLTGGQEARGHGTVGDDVRDPTWRAPILWFQDSEADPGTPRQRFHLDVWVPRDVAGTRIAAAVAAGAVVVDDSHAPSFTVLADPDGNKACVCSA